MPVKLSNLRLSINVKMVFLNDSSQKKSIIYSIIFFALGRHDGGSIEQPAPIIKVISSSKVEGYHSELSMMYSVLIKL